MNRKLAIGWMVAALGALVLGAPVSLQASDQEHAVHRVYAFSPPAPQGQTQEQADAKRAGCGSCHSASDAATMHNSPSVVLGCVDCHGGDPKVTAAEGL